MYKKIYLSVSIFCCVMSGNITIAQASSLECENYAGCERKFCEIQKQITIAKENDNERRLNGLNIAFKEAKSNCSDESIVADLLLQIDETEEDILAYEQDLKEAEYNNKKDKVLKYNNKITEEKLELQQLKNKLSTLQ